MDSTGIPVRLPGQAVYDNVIGGFGSLVVGSTPVQLNPSIRPLQAAPKLSGGGQLKR